MKVDIPPCRGTSNGGLREGSVYALRSCSNIDAEGYLRAQYHPHQDISPGVGDTTLIRSSRGRKGRKTSITP